MLSTLELRHIIESEFLPLSCICSTDTSGCLQIKIVNPESGAVELFVMGPPTADLYGREVISRLIKDIRGELEVVGRMRSGPSVLGGPKLK